MNKQYFRNDYCIIVYTNIQGVFQDYDLYVHNKYYATYYSIQDLLLNMKGVYDEIFNKETKAITISH